MKNWITISITVFLFNISFSQEILSPQLKEPARPLTTFSFNQYNGGVMVIKACLNDNPDSLNFILDTGSGGISLDSTTCALHAIPNRPSDTIITGLGGTHKVNFAFNQRLRLPGLTVENLNFHINDYEVLTSVYGEKIDGIIGYNFFSRYIVKFDFDSNKIEVYEQGEMEYPRGGSLLRPIFTSIPIEPLVFKDSKRTNFNFYFDTGAGICFLLNEKFVNDSMLLLKKRRPVTTQAEGMGGKLQMRLTVVKQVQIGHYRFRNVPTYLYKDDFNVTSYPFVGGLIGNDLLRRFNIILNYNKREIHIIPNKHYFEPFDYAYTGIAIYFVNGSILVDEIIAGSPAEKAGLKTGDILIAVDKNFSNDIQQYKTLLQNANQKIKLIVRRNEDLLELVLQPKSFLR